MVLDTDVIVAAFRSPSGASAALLDCAAEGKVQLIASTGLFLEYEAVVKRPEQLFAMGLSLEEGERKLYSLAKLFSAASLYFRWRPQVTDPDDEMVLETAINGEADLLVTFNLRDYGSAPARFGIEAVLPREALRRIRI